MQKYEEVLQAIVSRFAALNEVEGILLAGSLTNNTQDEHSDIDLYVYQNAEIPVDKRDEITKEFTSYMELNNQFWETEDDGILKDLNMGLEIIYRDFNWIKADLERILDQHQGSVGYSTCFWSNYLSSKILYDRDGKFTALQEKYNVPYPKELKQSIIEKNYPLLRKSMCSYYDQIEKALKRNDLISINHRVASLLASYFDILFAVNEMPHPGEKKLIKIVKSKCSLLPNGLEEDIQRVLEKSVSGTKEVLDSIDILVDHLDILLEEQNLM